MNRLSIFRDRNLVGSLWLDQGGRYLFQYDQSWLGHSKKYPISLSLPLREEPFDRDCARSFFANLLPEGEVRRLLAAKFGISPGSDFKLLQAIGGDCAGALSLLPEDSHPPETGSYRPLPQEELDRIIESMSLRPLLAAEEGVRLSLAGVQNKLPVHCEREDLFLPEGSFASSYILKPKILHVQDSVLNEAFCMILADHVGLPVAPVQLRSTGKNQYCLVKRFDRAEQHGTILRLHQEDLCQALEVMPDHKYENEGGPGFGDCFQLLETKSRQPAADKKALIQWAVFNFLIGNTDAHGKNVALLISEDGVQLAPFYDLMSTAAYPELSARMAMKIGGEYARDRIFRRHWERFADTASVKANFVFQTIQKMSAMLPRSADELFSRFPEFFHGKHVILEILAQIREHCASVEKNVLTGTST
jgi:serine/threonine-protein kinase HipA